MKKILIITNDEYTEAKNGSLSLGGGLFLVLTDKNGKANICKASKKSFRPYSAVYFSTSSVDVLNLTAQETAEVLENAKRSIFETAVYRSAGVINPITGKSYAKEDEGYKENARKIIVKVQRKEGRNKIETTDDLTIVEWHEETSIKNMQLQEEVFYEVR